MAKKFSHLFLVELGENINMADVEVTPVVIEKDPFESLLSRLDKGWYHYVVFISISFAYFTYGFTITT